MSEEKHNKKINRDILKWVVIGLAGFAIIILIFGAGMIVGGMKAKFSYHWAESYHKNFAGPRSGFLGDWRSMPSLPGDFIEAHGAFGEVISILSSSATAEDEELKNNGFIVKGQGDIEKIVITNKDTVIKKGMETIEDSLKVGDRVVIIGSPNEEGQIEAKLIRIFDGELKDSSMPSKRSQFPFF